MKINLVAKIHLHLRIWGLTCLLCLFGKSLLAQTASFTSDITEGCSPVTVFFDASASTGTAPLTYHWDFGNGNTITSTDPERGASYINPGTYTVTLSVEDASGNMSPPTSLQITAFEKPEAAFTLNGNFTGCTPLTVDFENASAQGSGNITSYTWAFGDGRSASDESPDHTYNNEGNYTAKLVVEDNNGCRDDFTFGQDIRAVDAPVVDFSVNEQSTCSNSLSVSFNDQSQYPSGLDPGYTYTWNFGDGQTSSSRNPDHTYSTQGVYDVSFEVAVDGVACTQEKVEQAFINVGIPNEDFTANVTSTCSGTEVTFTLADSVNQAFNYRWDYGDGQTATVNQKQHTYTYTSSGSFNARLTIQGKEDTDCIVRDSTTVNSQINEVGFTTNDTLSCAIPYNAAFNASYDHANSFEWDFGDGNTSTSENPTHTYTTEGTFDVQLTITDTIGCQKIVQKNNLVITGGVEPDFNTDGNDVSFFPPGYNLSNNLIRGGCSSDSVTFVDQSSANTNIVNYEWDFGDGSPVVNTTATTVRHLYSEGIYSPSLTIETADGCQETFQCNDCVIRADEPTLDVNVVPNNPINCCGYDVAFDNLTDTSTVDLIWYFLSSGERASFVKNNGQPFEDGGDWSYQADDIETPICGASLNMDMAVFNNGCAADTAINDIQETISPRVSGELLQEECQQNWQPGEILDMNDTTLFEWELQWPATGAIDSLRITFDVTGGATQNGFVIDTMYNITDHGFDVNDTIDCGDSTYVIARSIDIDSLIAYGMLPKKMVPANFFPDTTGTGYDLEIETWNETEGNTCSCTFSEAQFFNVVDNPEISIAYSDTSGCAPFASTFDVLNDTSFTNIQWTFTSDNNTVNAAGDSTEVTFHTPGDYGISLSAATADCPLDTTFQDTIRVLGPVIDFALSKTNFCLNFPGASDSLSITDNSLSDSSIVSRTMEIGGFMAVTDTADTLEHFVLTDTLVPGAINQPEGIYVKLKLEDQIGCTASDSQRIFLRNPQPYFTASVTQTCDPSINVAIADIDSIGIKPFVGEYRFYELLPNDTIPVDTLALPADGSASLPAENKEYLINLFIEEDARGACQATSADTTLFVEKPVLKPVIDLNDTTFTCSPATVFFADSSYSTITSTIDTWQWNYYNQQGDVIGGSEEQNPVEIFDEGGYISVSLHVEDNLGCEADLTKDSLIFIGEVNGETDLPSDSICIGEPAEFYASSNSNASIVWDFGDGVVVKGDSVEHAYDQAGIRIPTIIIEDASGSCNIALNDTIHIVAPPGLDLGPDLDLCMGDSTEIGTGFTDYYQHEWSTGAADTSITIKEEGTYHVTMIDSIVKCTARDTLFLNVDALPEIAINEHPMVCRGETVPLAVTTDDVITTYQWQLDGEDYSSQATDSFDIEADTVAVDLAVVDENGCGQKDSALFRSVVYPAIQLADTFFCQDESVQLEGLQPGYTETRYYWTFQGDTVNSQDSVSQVEVNKAGTYVLNFFSGICNDVDSLNVEEVTKPDPTLNEDLFPFCKETETAQLDAGEYASYEWLFDNSTGQILEVDEPGTYYFRIFNEKGCATLDSTVAENRCAPRVFVPDAFTPNGDGDNDIFKIYQDNVGGMEFLIYNRWGEVVFRTTTTEKGWDGKFRGREMPSGVYPWYVKYKGDNVEFDETRVETGKLTLLR